MMMMYVFNVNTSKGPQRVEHEGATYQEAESKMLRTFLADGVNVTVPWTIERADGTPIDDPTASPTAHVHCDECGAVEPTGSQLLGTWHDESCSLHPSAVTAQ
jgi:hypothetical protein